MNSGDYEESSDVMKAITCTGYICWYVPLYIGYEIRATMQVVYFGSLNCWLLKMSVVYILNTMYDNLCF